MIMTGTAFAEIGNIGLFSDPGGTVCNLYDDVTGLVQIYVVLSYIPTWIDGAMGARFMVECDDGVNMIYIDEIIPDPFIAEGNSLTGIDMGSPICYPSPHLILTIRYYGQGLSDICSYCRVVAHPVPLNEQYPEAIYIIICDGLPYWFSATGGEIVINPDAGCNCDVPVEETSWGKIKSLYR
jgi:hypothetical protein